MNEQVVIHFLIHQRYSSPGVTGSLYDNLKGMSSLRGNFGKITDIGNVHILVVIQ